MSQQSPDNACPANREQPPRISWQPNEARHHNAKFRLFSDAQGGLSSATVAQSLVHMSVACRLALRAISGIYTLATANGQVPLLSVIVCAAILPQEFYRPPPTYFPPSPGGPGPTSSIAAGFGRIMIELRDSTSAYVFLYAMDSASPAACRLSFPTTRCGQLSSLIFEL